MDVQLNAAEQAKASASRNTDRAAPRERLLEAIEHASELLPAQGPITVFIHHNTLHAFEHLPFDEAVRQGAAVFGCEPYLSESAYRQMFVRGRIRHDDLVAVLREDLGESGDEPLCVPGSRLSLRLAMLEHPLRSGPTAELRWFVAQTDALQRFLDHAPEGIREQLVADTKHELMHELSSVDARPLTEREWLGRLRASAIDDWSDADWQAITLQLLWQTCRAGTRELPDTAPQSQPLRHRDLLLAVSGVDSDQLVHDVLIRLCAAYCDQGVAHWTLPRRNDGLWVAFCELYGVEPATECWLRALPALLQRIQAAQQDPLASIQESLDELGVEECEWADFLTPTLLALRGWGGMLRQNEIRPDRVAYPARPGTVIEFLAVRLILERLALAYLLRTELGYHGPLSAARSWLRAQRGSQRSDENGDQAAFTVFQLAQVMGWSARTLRRLSRNQWRQLVQEVNAFGDLDRRRVFHLAFERRFRIQALDALLLHARRGPVEVAEPRWQVLFCLDEREESIRRHLEEVAPESETIGAAGFFCAAMYYKGAADAHFVPLCPVVIRPKHWVVEDVALVYRDAHEQRTKVRRTFGTLTHRLHVASRTFAGGALLTMSLGVLASVPLVARVLFPRAAARFRRAAGRLMAPPPVTRLQIERMLPEPAPVEGGFGFSVEEMADVCERLLRDTGLTKRFARLVALVGHGSSSWNNPHRSAYDCGACGGNHGHPNARAVSQMLNDVRVREILARRGIVIPPETLFVGGLHNTCADVAHFFDLERIPKSHEAEFEALLHALHQACDRNAHERCRRFLSAPLTLSFAEARRHVAERAEDLAQTRPELGHATNALCIVGRRSRTRGLFLDRRAFLASYDPTQDTAEYAVLNRILSAIFPVCAGINLEYYFSRVDPRGWGCDTKLPHNVAALLGVMDGPASDLRTGLPWQMVELHEPVRLLWVIENTPEALLFVMERNETVRRMCHNEWVHLATLSPHAAEIHYFHKGQFVPYCPEATSLPTARSSIDWYRGWRDHLPFAEIDATAAAEQGDYCS
jgi:uncharacterized protein YbcC (UPF0753/DUF2309 family)